MSLQPALSMKITNNKKVSLGKLFIKFSCVIFNQIKSDWNILKRLFLRITFGLDLMSNNILKVRNLFLVGGQYFWCTNMNLFCFEKNDKAQNSLLEFQPLNTYLSSFRKKQMLKYTLFIRNLKNPCLKPVIFYIMAILSNVCRQRMHNSYCVVENMY